MIYIMNGKTFQKIFLKENPKKILETQFIIVSSRIRRGKYGDRKNVISLSKQLMPSDVVLADYRMELDKYFFQEKYAQQIKQNLSTLAVIVRGVVEENFTVVFLCSEREWKLKYLKYIGNAIENYFGFPVYDYKKIKTGKEKPRSYDKAFVIDRCDKYLMKAKKKYRKKLMQTEAGRKKLVEQMSKDEMSAELKRLKIYTKGMSKKEMKELLELMFVER